MAAPASSSTRTRHDHSPSPRTAPAVSPALLSHTAYHGSEGHIDDMSVAPAESDRDSAYADALLAEPAKPSPLARPALSSRLLSTLSTAQQASAGLTRTGSVLHSRAKSWASFAPKLPAGGHTSSASVSASASASEPHPHHPPNRLFGDLFNGESAPIKLGITPPSPTKEDCEFVMEYQPSFTARPPAPRRRSTAHTRASQSSASLPRASWFSRKAAGAGAAPPAAAAAARAHDELATCDITAQLFPHGPADPLSPHAFNDLLVNATNLLQRMQGAYRAKVDYIASMQPEMDAQKEEVEEAETRARHLKMQLEDMGRQAEEQNRAMQELAAQMAAEKVKAAEAHDAYRRATLQLAAGGSSPANADADADADDTPRRRKRGSAGSHASDSGFESDAEYAESVVSAGIDTPLTTPIMTLTPAGDGPDWPLPSAAAAAAAWNRPDPPSPLASRPGSGASAYGGKNRVIGAAPPDALPSTTTMESLRGENLELRRQMDEMQRMLQGCIDFVSAVNV